MRYALREMGGEGEGGKTEKKRDEQNNASSEQIEGLWT